MPKIAYLKPNVLQSIGSELQSKMDKINSELILDESQELADYILTNVFTDWHDFRRGEGIKRIMQ